MRRGFLSTLAWVGTAVGVGLAACGESSGETRPNQAAGEGGEAGAGIISGAGGTAAGGGGGADDGGGDAGGGSAGTGGSRGGAAGDSSGGTGNRATGGSSAGTEAGGAGEGGAGGSGEPDPVVCDRFSEFQAATHADHIRLTFERTTNVDCRLSWFLTLYLPPVDQRAEFGNNLIQLTLKLWGCIDEPPTAFQLIHTPVPLSPAEARALIDVYLNASRTEAALSPSEISVVEAQLERLAEPLIDTNLADFSRSRCTGGMGGMGGGGMSGMGGSGMSGNGMGGFGGIAGTAGTGGAPGGEGGLGEGGVRAALD